MKPLKIALFIPVFLFIPKLCICQDKFPRQFFLNGEERAAWILGFYPKKYKVKQIILIDTTHKSITNYDKDGFIIDGDPIKWKTIIKKDTVIKLGYDYRNLPRTCKYIFQKGFPKFYSWFVPENGSYFYPQLVAETYTYYFDSLSFPVRVEIRNKFISQKPTDFKLNNDDLKLTGVKYYSYDTVNKIVVTSSGFNIFWGNTDTLQYDEKGKLILFIQRSNDTTTFADQSGIFSYKSDCKLTYRYNKEIVYKTFYKIERDMYGSITASTTYYEEILFPNGLPKVEYRITENNKRKIIRTYSYQYYK